MHWTWTPSLKELGEFWVLWVQCKVQSVFFWLVSSLRHAKLHFPLSQQRSPYQTERFLLTVHSSSKTSHPMRQEAPPIPWKPPPPHQEVWGDTSSSHPPPTTLWPIAEERQTFNAGINPPLSAGRGNGTWCPRMSKSSTKYSPPLPPAASTALTWVYLCVAKLWEENYVSVCEWVCCVLCLW